MKNIYFMLLFLIPLIAFSRESILENEIQILQEYVETHKDYEPVLAEYKTFNAVLKYLFSLFEKKEWKKADNLINAYIKKKRCVFNNKSPQITDYYIYKFMALLLYYKSNLFVEHDKEKATEYLYISYFIVQQKCRPYEITEMFNYPKLWKATAKLYVNFMRAKIFSDKNYPIMYMQPFEEERFFYFLRAEDKPWKHVRPKIDDVKIELIRLFFMEYDKLKYFSSIKDTLFFTYWKGDSDLAEVDKKEIMKQICIKLKNVEFIDEKKTPVMSIRYDKKVFNTLLKKNLLKSIPQAHTQ